jgi:hypothetical protein
MAIMALMGDRVRVSTLGLRAVCDGAGRVSRSVSSRSGSRAWARDDCRRLVRPGDRQRAVGLRALDDRADPEASGGHERSYGFDVDFERAKHNLEENDGAGNTFKATAKPVLIGTAVVGATTMIFSIIVALTDGLKPDRRKLSLLHPPFLLG